MAFVVEKNYSFGTVVSAISTDNIDFDTNFSGVNKYTNGCESPIRTNGKPTKENTVEFVTNKAIELPINAPTITGIPPKF
jgi:hypothetical protein